MFTLAISCLTTSNLPWPMDLKLQHNIVLYSIRLYFHYQSYPQLSIVSALFSLFIPSVAISSFSSGSILGMTWWVHLSVSSFCLFILFMGFSRKDYWSSFSFPSLVDHGLSNSPPWPVHLVCPYMAWLMVSLSSTRLWSMWSVWLIFCDCGFHSVCPLG